MIMGWDPGPCVLHLIEGQGFCLEAWRFSRLGGLGGRVPKAGKFPFSWKPSAGTFLGKFFRFHFYRAGAGIGGALLAPGSGFLSFGTLSLL